MSDVDLSIFDHEGGGQEGEGSGHPAVEKILESAQELRQEGAVLKVAMDIPPPRELHPDQVVEVIGEVLERYRISLPDDIAQRLREGDTSELVFLVAADKTGLRPRKVVICLDPEIRTLSIRGEAPLNGLDSFVEVFIDYQVKAGRVREDGSIDFREINRFPQARAGELLVRLYMPTEGVPGIDVYGEPVPPQPGRSLEIQAGEGVELREGYDQERSRKTQEFVAEKSGVVICRFDGEQRSPDRLRELSVKNRIEVINVDFTTGNLGSEVEEIRCIADVVVKGDIKGLFSVIIDGNLEVYGSVEGRLIDVSQTFSALFVKSRVRAGKAITVGSCLNAELEAGEEVVVQRECAQSRLAADRVVFHPKGAPYVLCGVATVEANETILSKVMIRNRVQVEVAPALLARRSMLQKGVKQTTSALEQASAEIKDRVAALSAKLQVVEKGYSGGPVVEAVSAVRSLVAGMLKGEVTTARVTEAAHSLHGRFGGGLKAVVKAVEGVVALQERINRLREELEEFRSQLEEVEERLQEVRVEVNGILHGNGAVVVRMGQQELAWGVAADGRPTPLAVSLRYVQGEGLIKVG